MRRSHRVSPHTADAIIEADAPTMAECLSEAVQALAEVFVESAGVQAGLTRVPVAVARDDPLGRLLEEVLFVLDARHLVCLGAELRCEESGCSGDLLAVPARDVEVIGSIPKGIAGAEVVEAGDGWRARAIVDV